MSSVYTSIKHYSTYVNTLDIKKICQEYDTNIINLNISSLSSVYIQPILKKIKNKKFMFDKLKTENDSIDDIDYSIIVTSDLNNNFIDSFDTHSVSSSNVIFNEYFNLVFLDSNQDQDTNNKIETYKDLKFFKISNENYLLLEITMNNYKLFIFIQTFRDNSIMPDFDNIDNPNQYDNYGFDIYDEDDIIITNAQNPNVNIFEYST